MSLFTDDEYRKFSMRPALDEAWERLPIITTVNGVGLRWIGPLVDLGHDQWLGELAQAAWGYLEDCGWHEALAEGGDMLDGDGSIRTEWSSAFGRAARSIAEAGACSGPENDLDRWGSWIAAEMSAPRAYVEGIAETKGWGQ